ncbi:hypothetical protein [Acinetobacter sp.]|uniref:hypothetical protein n=1 Tax=Acinetobacter sp. TaxID=472 RepID=UPI003D06C6A1
MNKQVSIDFTQFINQNLVKYMDAREKLDDERQLGIITQREILTMVDKSFRNLISKRHISTIPTTFNSSTIVIGNSGFSRRNYLGRTANIKTLKKDTAFEIIKDIFYNKKNEVSDWLKTLPNRNKAVYNMHKLLCDALEPYYKEMSIPYYKEMDKFILNAIRTHKPITVLKRATLDIDLESINLFNKQSLYFMDEQKHVVSYDYLIYNNGELAIEIKDNTNTKTMWYVDILSQPQILFLIYEELPNITEQTLGLVAEIHNIQKSLHDAFDYFKSETLKLEVMSQL